MLFARDESMPTPLTVTQIEALPIHDAEYVGISIIPQSDGSLKVRMGLRIHPEEPLDQLACLGITGRTCFLVLSKCWLVAANLLGVFEGRESVDRWELVEETDLLRQVKQTGFGASAEFRHHRLVFSGGSTLDVIAECACLSGDSQVTGDF
jgi:hypothetical protein